MRVRVLFRIAPIFRFKGFRVVHVTVMDESISRFSASTLVLSHHVIRTF